jgi:hypothetical protein
MDHDFTSVVKVFFLCFSMQGFVEVKLFTHVLLYYNVSISIFSYPLFKKRMTFWDFTDKLLEVNENEVCTLVNSICI